LHNNINNDALNNRGSENYLMNICPHTYSAKKELQLLQEEVKLINYSILPIKKR
jgi:hypothetical protein